MLLSSLSAYDILQLPFTPLELLNDILELHAGRPQASMTALRCMLDDVDTVH